MKKSGYLTKTNKKGKQQERYFVLDGAVLSFYKQPLGKRLGVVDLNHAQVVGLGKRYFLISSQQQQQETRKFVISGKDEGETLEWKQVLLRAQQGTQQKQGGASGDKFGWMSKKGKERWFLLHEGILYWFIAAVEPNSDFRKKARGSLPLLGCTVGSAVGVTNGIQIVSTDTSYVLSCSSPEDKASWLEALQQALAQPDIQICGFLEKKKQQRYFVLRGDVLSWYLNERDGREKGQISMSAYQVSNDTEVCAINLVNTKDTNVRYRLLAKDGNLANEWKGALRQAIEQGRNKMRERQATTTTPSSGLEKKGWLIKKRKRRYFVLKNNVLMWFINESDASPKGSLNVRECLVTSRNFDINIRTKDKTLYTLTAQRKPEVDEWMAVLQEANSMAAKPVKVAASDSSLSPQMLRGKSGWVVKKGLRRFLVLRPGDLLYFDKEQRNVEQPTDKPKGVIRLACCTVNEASSHTFLVRSEETANKGWMFECRRPEECREWVDLITVFIIRAQNELGSGLSKSGWLTKKGQKRWFALKNGTLMWFNEVMPPESIVAEAANGSMRMEGVKLSTVRDKQATFLLEPPDQKAYELVAFNAKEVEGWLMALRSVAMPGMMHADPFKSSNPNGKVFGKPLVDVLRFDKADVPKIVTSCTSYLLKHGLQAPGIFRLSGNANEVNHFRDVFDNGGSVDFEREEDLDVNAVAGVFKLWIRQLPEPPLTYTLYDEFLQCRSNVDGLRSLIERLPDPNFNLLYHLVYFLAEVIKHEEENHMNVSNMAIVIGPNLLRKENSDMISGLKDTPLILEATKTIITNRDYVFGEQQ